MDTLDINISNINILDINISDGDLVSKNQRFSIGLSSGRTERFQRPQTQAIQCGHVSNIVWKLLPNSAMKQSIVKYRKSKLCANAELWRFTLSTQLDSIVV